MTHTNPADIEMIVVDVDGVLTDGSIFYDNNGGELKRFNTKDGFGIRLWMKLGFRFGIITGRESGAVSRRAGELGIEDVVQGSKDKDADLRAMCERAGVTPERCAFVGDDWPDLPAMAIAGYPVAVGDAHRVVVERAAWVTTLPGGRGAVRETIDHLIDHKGLMDEALGR